MKKIITMTMMNDDDNKTKQQHLKVREVEKTVKERSLVVVVFSFGFFFKYFFIHTLYFSYYFNTCDYPVSFLYNVQP